MFNDYINIVSIIGENLKEVQNTKKEEKPIIITVKKIQNPFNNDKINNIKKIINSNEQLLDILMKLLKNKNGDYTRDIWNMIKDKDSFLKNENGFLNTFNDLINNRNDKLNELCNFNDTNMFYKNFILSSLYNFLSNKKNEEKQLVNKFIESNLWIQKIKNLLKEYYDKKNNEKNNKNISSINELIEEKNYIYNILNIYKIIINNIPENNENLEFIIKEIFNIFYDIINDCLYLDFNSLNKDDINDKSNNIYDIKKIYLTILNAINEIFNNKNVVISFLKLLESENEFNEDDSAFNTKFNFGFVDGILKNNYPFLNEKISKILISIIRNNIEDQNIINDLKKSYLLISSIFFSDENNQKTFVILKELFNDNDNKKINIYEYNLKLYYKTIGAILNALYKYTYDEFDYEKYIIKFVVPYIYEPLLKDIKKESILHDLYFGGQCILLYNYIQVMNNTKIDEEKNNLIFNYKGKILKNYLFNEIIMYKCDKDAIPLNNKNKRGKNIKIINSLVEANHLLISILMRDLKEENNKFFIGGDLIYYLDKINHFNKLEYFKGNLVSDWKLNFREEANSTTFIGLKNLGCTCYMNSLLQVFYHIIPFRESLLKCYCKKEKKNSLYEVKKVFKSLKYTNDQNYYTPNSFVNNFDNEILNIHQQMDVDEFFANILDKLENRLKKTDNENLIKYFFQGRLNDTLTFQEECTHHRTNVNSFYSIQLQVQHKKNIYESLDTFIEGELMNGDNCIYCPQCDRKFPAIKSQNIKTLPRMLMFVLKRFEFDYDTMRKIKIQDFYEFPIELDMNKYTNEYINNKNNKQNNKYILKSVVVHQGQSEGGHYYAFIKDNLSQTWYKFNDTKVTKFDINDLANETYGDKDGNKSAYLLFYEKVDDSNCETFDKIKAINSLNKKNEDNDDFSLFDNNNEDNNENNDNEIIDDDNEIENNKEDSFNNLNKVLFSNEYHHFTLELYINILNNIDYNNNLPNLFDELCLINNEHPFQTELNNFRNKKIKGSNLTKNINKEKIIIFKDNRGNFSIKEKKEKIIELFKYIIINFFNIVIRSREKKYFGCYVDFMKFLINRYEYCANYILEEFSCYNVIFEYLVNCPLYEIKKVIVGIIYYAMNKSIETFRPGETVNDKEKIEKEKKNEKKEIKEKEKKNEKKEIKEKEKDNKKEQKIELKENKNKNDKNNDILNDPKYKKIKENEKVINNFKSEKNNIEIIENPKKTEKNENFFGFEEFTDEEIAAVKNNKNNKEIAVSTKKNNNNKEIEVEVKTENKKKDKNMVDDFEIMEKESKKDDKKILPITEHYLDIIHKENKELQKFNNNEGYTDEDIVKKEDPLEYKNISSNILKLVYNIVYAMKKIKYTNKRDSRFLYAVLLRFSLLSKETRYFLRRKVNMQLLLNILLFQECRECDYDSSEITNIDQGLFDTSHDILNSNPYHKILGEPDKLGKFYIINYHFLLLCNLLYYEERPKEEIEYRNEDIGFTFYNEKYIEELIKYASTKQDINYLSNLFAKKCFNNKTIFENILNKLIDILERMSDSENSFYDLIEEEKNNEIYKNSNDNNLFLKRLRNNIDIIFKKTIFDINDNNNENRLKNSLSKLYSLFKDNKKYYGITISIINIIIDISYFSLENDNLTEKNQKILRDISDWLNKNNIPPKLYDIKGIKMYRKDDDVMANMYYSHSKNKKDINKQIIEEFDKEEIRKTNKKIEIINKILSNSMDKDISSYNCDLTDFKFAIGDQIIYENKDYIITECLDELIKIKLMDKKIEDKEFKVNGFHEKKMNLFEKEKISFWVETDNYNIRIKKLVDNDKNNE